MSKQLTFAFILCLFAFSNPIFGQSSQTIFFDVKMIEEATDIDERYGKDDKCLILIKSNQIVIDTMSAYGIPELIESKTTLYLTSNLIEKTYEIISSKTDEFVLHFSSYCADCDQQERTYDKKYLRNNQGNWKVNDCQGDCDDN